MSEITRRDLLGRLAAAFVAGASIDHLLAQAAHHLVQQSTAGGGPSTPKALSLSEFRTLERLTDLIIPIENGKPGAVAAGVPEWIDTLLAVNDELKARYTKGLAWLDAAMKSRGASDFTSATRQQQTTLLD